MEPGGSLPSSSSSPLIYPPKSMTYTPGTYNPNARGPDPCRGSNSLWNRTLDRYTRAGLPKCVVSTMSGPPSKTTQDRTQTKDTHPIPGQKWKFLTPPGIEPGPPHSGSFALFTEFILLISRLLVLWNRPLNTQFRREYISFSYKI